MMKIDFYFIWKALFILKIFESLSWLFGHVSKQLDKKDKINLEFYDVTAWLTNNCNTHIGQYLKKKDNQTVKFGQLIDYKTKNIFLGKSYTKCVKKLVPGSFVQN